MALPSLLYILITNASSKHTLRRQTINQCPWASRDRSLGQNHTKPSMRIGYCGSGGSLLRRTEEVVDTTPTLLQTAIHDTIGGCTVFQNPDCYKTLQLDGVDALCLTSGATRSCIKGQNYDDTVCLAKSRTSNSYNNR